MSSLAQKSIQGLFKHKRPTYFMQTKEGAYPGMIKHNLLQNTRSSIGSSLAFTDLSQQTSKLEKYAAQTGKSALEYFNLIKAEDYFSETSKKSSDVDTTKLTLFQPFPSQFKASKHLLLTGFTGQHTEYLVMNRHKMTQADYMSLLKLLAPEIAVSPIEHVTAACGRRKILRTSRSSLKSY